MAGQRNLRDWNTRGRNREPVPNALRKGDIISAGKGRGSVGQERRGNGKGR